MSYKIVYSNKFKKALKKCHKRGLDIEQLQDVLKILEEEGALPSEFKPHKLSGKFQGNWECHIQPDWLLVWEQRDEELILLLIDTGSHFDLFG